MINPIFFQRQFPPPTRTHPRIINPLAPVYSNAMRGMVMIARTITTYHRWHGELSWKCCVHYIRIWRSDTRNSRAQPLELAEAGVWAYVGTVIRIAECRALTAMLTL